MTKLLFLLPFAVLAMPAWAVTASVPILVGFGVPTATAQCIVETLGQGAELDEADDEPEGELDTATMRDIAGKLRSTNKMNENLQYRRIAGQITQKSDKQKAFIDAATLCR